jgi:lipase chaperone LimK
VALRAILLNVMFKLANGQPLTAEEMQRVIDRADSDKPKKTRDRLLPAQESEGQRKEKF